MPFEIKDLVGLSKPLTKLIENVSKGLGITYRPRAIRQEADARAYEIKTVARAQAEAKVQARGIELAAVTDMVQVALVNQPELANRVTQRILHREIENQCNLESVIDHAAEALPPVVSEEPLDDDWRKKFFLEAENICDADMQQLWGKVLAGEITKPGSFSLRALDTLKHLSHEEAEVFRKACAIAMNGGWIVLPEDSINTSLVPFGLSYGDILKLRDAGLVVEGDDLHREFKGLVQQGTPIRANLALVNNGVQILVTPAPNSNLQLPVIPFTGAGQQLMRLIDAHETAEYLVALGTELRRRGCVAKRGTPLQIDATSSVTTFEQDL